MKTKHIYLLGLSVLFMGTGCINTHYELSTITRTRLVVDHRYDASPDVDAQLFMANYKHHVDSVMGPVVGEVAHDMAVQKRACFGNPAFLLLVAPELVRQIYELFTGFYWF